MTNRAPPVPITLHLFAEDLGLPSPSFIPGSESLPGTSLAPDILPAIADGADDAGEASAFTLDPASPAGFSELLPPQTPSLWRPRLIRALAVESPTPRSWEEAARRVRELLDAFLSASPEPVRAQETILAFWNIGMALAETLRASADSESDALYRLVSERVLADNATVLDGVRGFGFDIAQNFTPENLADMHRLALVFPRAYLAEILPNIEAATRASWSLIRELTALDDPCERVYYAEMCAQDRWNLTTLRHHLKMGRFHTHTVARFPADRLKTALVSLARGDRTEWIYRDLLRFDFLDIDDARFEAMREPEFQELLLKNVDEIITELGDENFNYKRSQPMRPCRDDAEGKHEPRLDILADVNDGIQHYPVVIELKKGAFTEKVLRQCRRYEEVMRGPAGHQGRMRAGYLKPNESKVLIMALVTKFNRDFETIMRVGLNGDARRASIFVSLYTYREPPKEFLEKAIGAQIKASAERVARERARLLRNEPLGPSRRRDPDGVAELFDRILGATPAPAPEPPRAEGDESLPF